VRSKNTGVKFSVWIYPTDAAYASFSGVRRFGSASHPSYPCCVQLVTLFIFPFRTVQRKFVPHFRNSRELLCFWMALQRWICSMSPLWCYVALRFQTSLSSDSFLHKQGVPCECERERERRNGVWNQSAGSSLVTFTSSDFFLRLVIETSCLAFGFLLKFYT